MVSHRFVPSTMPHLCALVFGLLFLAEAEKYVAAIGASSSLDPEMSVTNHIRGEHNERMLGSENTGPGEFSFFTQWGGCGATLIWEDLLLTSASCDVVEDNNVLIGSHASHQQEGDSVRRNVVSRYKHPKFDPDTLMYNYMILKLDEKVDTLPHVWIDPTIEIPTDAELFVVGYGFTASRIQINHIYEDTFHHTVLDTTEILRYGNDDGPTSRMQGSDLQKIEANIVPHGICNANDQYAGFVDDKTMICANNEDGDCLGDNGGPLCMMVNNGCLQIGIVSFGESCAMGYRPSVYSSISAASAWIEKKICNLSRNPPSSCPTPSPSQEPSNLSTPDVIIADGRVEDTASSSLSSSSSCSTEHAKLEECIDSSGGGSFGMCKSCIKAATKSPTASQFALNSCVDGLSMCIGCQSESEDYYDCLKEDPNPNGSQQQTVVVDATVPDDRADLDTPDVVIVDGQVEDAVSPSLSPSCSTEHDELEECIDSSGGGSFGMCKSCIKAATKSPTASQFALDSCVDGLTMCNGCQSESEDYYDCLKEDPNPNGSQQQTVVVNATVPDDRADLDTPDVVIVDGQVEDAVSPSLSPSCLTEHDELEECIDSSGGGSFGMCKSCIKAATKSPTASQFALDSCVDGLTMCNGCQSESEDYYDCLKEDPNPNGSQQQTVVVNATVPDDRADLDTPDVVIVDGQVEDAVSPSLSPSCLTEHDELEECIDSSGGGSFGMCKSCIKAATKSPTASQFALNSCVDGLLMCIGCQSESEDYYDCLKEDPNPNGSQQQTVVVDATVPDDRADLDDSVAVKVTSDVPTGRSKISAPTRRPSTPDSDISDSSMPSDFPSLVHSDTPIDIPSTEPSIDPYASPSSVPSDTPIDTPSTEPSLVPSASPSLTSKIQKNRGPASAAQKPSRPLFTLPPHIDPLDEFHMYFTNNISLTGEDYADFPNRREEETGAEKEEYDDNSSFPDTERHNLDATATKNELSELQTDRNLIQQPDLNFTMMPIRFFSFPIPPTFNTSSRDSSSAPLDEEILESRNEASNNTEIISDTEALPMLSPKKFGLCEGDCDIDEDCADGLFCFMKEAGVATVPGCDGFDTSRTDYCILNTHKTLANSAEPPILFAYLENPPNITNLPLQLCQGDCDSDADCADGLICYEKPSTEILVPGCSGISITRTDFCIDPNALIADTSMSSKKPSVSDSAMPTDFKDINPTFAPTTFFPTELKVVPTESPTSQSSMQTEANTADPTFFPTELKVIPTESPTSQSSLQTEESTADPTFFPAELKVVSTESPTTSQSSMQTEVPTELEVVPAESPTSQSSLQTEANTADPTFFPTELQTEVPTESAVVPTELPSSRSSSVPSSNALDPTFAPTEMLTQPPTRLTHSESESESESESLVSITVAIYYDPWPEEVSWKIESETTGLVAIALAGTYTAQQQSFNSVMVIPGEKYTFTIEDSGNDGIAGIGMLYEIYMTDQPDFILIEGDGVFEESRETEFHVPTIEEYPTSAPSEPTVSPAPTINTVSVYLIIIFDSWHQETSWTITAEDNPSFAYAEVEYDTYRAGESITEEIKLPPDQTYTFVIEDFFNDGIEDGEYLMMTDDGTVLFEGNGSFGSSRSHTFTLPPAE